MLATSTTAGDAVAVGGDAGVLVCSVLCPQREDARASDGDKGLISNSTKAPPAAAAARMISKNNDGVCVRVRERTAEVSSNGSGYSVVIEVDADADETAATPPRASDGGDAGPTSGPERKAAVWRAAAAAAVQAV
ncbi:hypothetical protein H106_07644 [Trichophyton rubrum CBS 735.88]|nr:hypothetical protein H106_07644 [Trichophyton rubrum CBS 735.88]